MSEKRRMNKAGIPHNNSGKKIMGSGTVRIISGRFKGRKLPVLDSQGLRPTTDRVKETLFNWLMFKVRDAKCLDAFAGSGALGFEAISRYAASVVMIEKDHLVAENLRKNSALLKTDNLKINEADTLTFLKNSTDSFDIIFLDPPFRKGILTEIYPLLTSKIAPEGCLVYVEEEAEGFTPPPARFKLLKEGTAGQDTYRLYIVNSEQQVTA